MEGKTPAFRKFIMQIGALFLIVMIVLTYFSGTIQNMLLPEVVVSSPYAGKLSYPMKADAEIRYVDGRIVYAETAMQIEAVYHEMGGSIKADTAIARINAPVNQGAANAAQNSSDNLLYAGVDGYVTAIYIQPGQRVSAGAPLFQYAPADTLLMARWTCSKETGKHFAKGHLVQYNYITRVPSSNIPQEFSGMGPIANAYFDSQTQQYTFEMVFSTPPEALTPDSAMTIDAASISSEYACLLPSSAVGAGSSIDEGDIFILLEDDEGNYTVKQQRVKKLAENDLLCAVDAQLNDNDQIIVSATSALKNGQRVRVR